ncbi:MAG: hypothetical protein ACOYXC_15235 [Candidatus Rifleibacteriota bacterium]
MEQNNNQTWEHLELAFNVLRLLLMFAGILIPFLLEMAYYCFLIYILYHIILLMPLLFMLAVAGIIPIQFISAFFDLAKVFRKG